VSGVKLRSPRKIISSNPFDISASLHIPDLVSEGLSVKNFFNSLIVIVQFNYTVLNKIIVSMFANMNTNKLYLIMQKGEVKLSYDSGWKLWLPVDGKGPRLFMEWLADYYLKYRDQPTYAVKTEENGIDTWFKVSFTHLLRDEADGLRIYLRENI
jgi:hypothetical protein